ncbi:DNA polymerase III subunit delta' [Paramagnetospirillum magneticum]|uniref:ATPase involved in DNA replication n=1 Tax=Paramagnetospirillum magneticum (strain ATCC 700264 / AMB-1) TaxID=342108 RepID=Q2W4H2_PARM1|nr:DNA polymerase III subunit delta' [Paramagnetospirillum magneticum]BAE51253.1 ATPase involved in DNA replication [Paramagnetospirillum magneticum AMB-1]
MTDSPHPRETSELFGHGAAESALLDAWNSGRLAHAWLLCGPKGIGKATLAYRFARFALAGGGDGGGLFGDVPSSLEIRPDHPVFRRIASQGHADLETVERGWADDKKSKLRSEIVVEDVRGIGHFMSLTPAEGGWRVVIIDSADEMNRNAANAVLKVLEEPPRNALMLLISHSPGRLLPTIRSRCRRLMLQPLGEDVVADLLTRQRPEVGPTEVAALAKLGEGSIGKALALADEGGLDLYRDLLNLLQGLPRLDVPALHAFGDKVARPENDGSFRTVTELLGWWLARLIRAGGRQGAGMAEVVAGEGALMERLLAAASLEHWLEVWEKITTLFARTEAVHLDRKQAVLGAFMAVERLARQGSR